ncbi:septin [Aspergillus sclerotioniger CBS 115572]|uniref:Septin n=1 Tax=Aspergillus sclerotioniger CBS 115572 TaxID=1450535 RepID=A0A317UYV5_9EURO|nr:septin [Aspergillus sclerotioniger CBS 115572]PWY67254.1 septin [Aspergillus sclerotioniger CBS 115572]
MATASPAPRTPGRTQPSAEVPPVVTETTKDQRRTSSLGFLRRSKSIEILGERRSSGSKNGKKMPKPQPTEEDTRYQRESMMFQQPPRLPDLSPAPVLETFGGDERQDTVAALSSQPAPSHQQAVPRSAISTPVTPEPNDLYSRAESMTHRGRYSYASSAVSTVNNPRRLRRRKDPTPYNVLVIGASNSGKTSFLNFLKSSLELPPHKHPSRLPEEVAQQARQSPANEGYISHYLETEIDGERVGLTLWDSQGLEKNIVDIQLRGVNGFLESKFEETLSEEMKVVRSPGARDTHIHCTFLILDPVRLDQNIAAAERAAQGTPRATDTPVIGVLDERLDVQVLRTIVGKTTVVPVISKADTITAAHMAYLRKAVWDSLKKANIDPLEILALDDQDEYTSSESDDEENEETQGQDADQQEAGVPRSPSQRSQSTRKSSGSQVVVQHIPFTTLSPDPHSLKAGDEPVGRKFPWGFADPYDPEHCDFLKLKEAVFTEWRADLREASRVVWYERWRTSRLNRNVAAAGSVAPQKKLFAGRTGPDVRRFR